MPRDPIPIRGKWGMSEERVLGIIAVGSVLAIALAFVLVG
jgi:hypothetical protein